MRIDRRDLQEPPMIAVGLGHRFTPSEHSPAGRTSPGGLQQRNFESSSARVVVGSAPLEHPRIHKCPTWQSCFILSAMMRQHVLSSSIAFSFNHATCASATTSHPPTRARSTDESCLHHPLASQSEMSLTGKTTTFSSKQP
jgi:hypothetical protein